jgi:hypothetical protein
MTSTFNYLDLSGPTIFRDTTVYSLKRLDFTEPSFGFTLGFDFGNGSTTVAEFDIVADAAIRSYNNNEKDGVYGAWSLDNTALGPIWAQDWSITAPDIFDLRITASPAFVYQSDLSEQLSIGFKVNVGAGYSMLTVTQELAEIGGTNSVTQETSETTLRIVPELGAGASFRLLPNRFAVHAGFGIELFSYEQIDSEIKQTISGAFAGTAGAYESKVTEKTMGLPNARFAAGFTLNFTANAAMDLLAISKNLDIDETKLTVLFTLKK